MLEIYSTENESLYKKLEILLERKLKKCFEIKRNENGKPFIDGNPLYFSLTHSRDIALIAICDKPVGIDLEICDKGLKSYKHVLNSFSKPEQIWIEKSDKFFFLNWVCKEAYIKMTGGSLGHDLKRLEFYDFRLFFDKKEIDYCVTAETASGVYALCAEGYSKDSLAGIPVNKLLI